jgi:AcrR family transcriptional regulator
MTIDSALGPRKLPSQARSRKRVEKILAATRKVLLNSGYEAITAKSIAAKAAVPIASFYQYFPNKESVINHLYQDWLADTHARYDEYEDLEASGIEWPLLFLKLRKSKEDNAESRKLELELQRAMDAIPELREIRQQANHLIATRMATIFRHYGSAWSDEELVNMGGVIIDLNREILERMDRQSDNVEMARHSQRVAMHGMYCMIERCIRGDHKASPQSV